jgi:hypothetical protein
LARSRWSVLQSGLVTTALALFGVYVLASRTDDTHVMAMYALGYVPVGALVVGLLAGSGYVLGAWWFGVRVRRGLLLSIVLIQLAAYGAGLYVEYACLTIYRDADETVSFPRWVHETTVDWTPAVGQFRRAAVGNWGYGLRVLEAGLFCLGALASALVLIGRPACEGCGGLLQRRRIGSVPVRRSAQVVAHLQEVAGRGSLKAFQRALRGRDIHTGLEPPPPPLSSEGRPEPMVELYIDRCIACGNGYISSELPPAAPADQGSNSAAEARRDAIAPRTPVAAELAALLFEHPTGETPEA